MKQDFHPLGEVFTHVQKLRLELKLPVLRHTASISAILQRKKVPYIYNGKRKLYHLPEALRACTQLRNRHDANPMHRPGTPQEIRSGQYLPLTECAKMWRCPRQTLTNATDRLAIKAWRHPHTNRVWCNIEDSMRTAFWHTYRFLCRHVGRKEADRIKAVRPRRQTLTEFGTVTTYLTPEYSHLSTTTSDHENL